MIASKESITRLVENASSTAAMLYPELKRDIAIFKSCGEDTSPLLCMIAELRMDSRFILLNLCSSLRALLSAIRPVEKRYFIASIDAELLESYKLLQGFGKIRKYTIWARIGNELNLKEDYNSLLDTYEQISHRLGTIAWTEQNRDGRNLTYHYDDDMSKVYRHLTDANDEDALIMRASSFMDVISRMLFFCDSAELLEAINGRRLPGVKDMDCKLQILNELVAKKFNGNKKLSDALEFALDHTPEIDDTYRTKESMAEMDAIFQKVSSGLEIEELGEIQELSNIRLLLQIALSGFVIVVRGYLNSGSEYEYPLALRRLTITRVSTLSHLYGYDTQERKKSLWMSLKNNILCLDESFQVSANEIEFELESLVDISDKDDRSLYVHLFGKKKSNIPNVIERLENINPVAEITKTESIIRVLTKIRRFLDQLIAHTVNDIKKKTSESNAMLLSQIQSIREMVNKCKGFPESVKQDFDSQMLRLAQLVQGPPVMAD